MTKEHDSRREREEREVVGDLERRLGVRQGFLHDLRSDTNDWSYLVRLQVFIESALGHAVCAELGRPELAGFISALHLGNRAGLGELAHALKVIDDREKAFLIELSRVRNGFAHKIENIDRTVEQYVRALPFTERRSRICALILADPPTAYTEDIDNLLTSWARDLLWWGVLLIASGLLVSTVRAEAARLRREVIDLKSKSFDQKTPISLKDLLNESWRHIPECNTSALFSR